MESLMRMLLMIVIALNTETLFYIKDDSESSHLMFHGLTDGLPEQCTIDIQSKSGMQLALTTKPLRSEVIDIIDISERSSSSLTEILEEVGTNATYRRGVRLIKVLQGGCDIHKMVTIADHLRMKVDSINICDNGDNDTITVIEGSSIFNYEVSSNLTISLSSLAKRTYYSNECAKYPIPDLSKKTEPEEKLMKMITMESKDDECETLSRKDVAPQVEALCGATRLTKCKRCKELEAANSKQSQAKTDESVLEWKRWLNFCLTLIFALVLLISTYFLDCPRYLCEYLCSTCIIGFVVMAYCPISLQHRLVAHRLFRMIHTSLSLVRLQLRWRFGDTNHKVAIWEWIQMGCFLSFWVLACIWTNWPEEERTILQQDLKPNLFQLMGALLLTIFLCIRSFYCESRTMFLNCCNATGYLFGLFVSLLWMLEALDRWKLYSPDISDVAKDIDESLRSSLLEEMESVITVILNIRGLFECLLRQSRKYCRWCTGSRRDVVQQEAPLAVSNVLRLTTSERVRKVKKSSDREISGMGHEENKEFE